jgi:hypothetical protein
MSVTPEERDQMWAIIDKLTLEQLHKYFNDAQYLKECLFSTTDTLAELKEELREVGIKCP